MIRLSVVATNADVLGTIHLFAGLSRDERSVLAERVEELEIKEGQTLFSYGDPGDSLYVVKSGMVELWVKNKTGEKVILEVSGPGDFFGEISLLDEGPRNATATVLESGEILCVVREDLIELVRLNPSSARELLTATGKRLRQTSLLLRNSATRNVNEVVEDKRTRIMKMADWIADFSGSIPFLMIHVGIFFFWIILNVGVFKFGNFDPFPFGLLTMVVSLEAIILSVFVLLSQNRQIERERVRSDIEYDVNLKAELQIQHMHEKIDHMNAEVLQRLSRLEKGQNSTPPSKR